MKVFFKSFVLNRYFKVLSLLLVVPIVSFGQIANHKLIITEIYADPTPSKGLPEAEFVEIYNPTNDTLSLAGYTFWYANQSKVIANGTILPKSYGIICAERNANLLESYGNIIPISSLTLNNTGSKIQLYTASGNLVDYVSYTNSWYQNDFDQGYSLELIDISKPCIKEGNWSSSISNLGATPGLSNSIRKETGFAPKLSTYEFSNNVLRLNFNHEIDVAFMKAIENYEVETPLRILKIEIDSTNTKTVQVVFEKGLPINTLVNFNILQIKNCFGEVAEPLNIKIGELAPPQKGEILISEIMFNPSEGGSDFLELFNASERTLNLKSFYIGNATSVVQLDSIDLFVGPNEYKVLTENSEFVINEFASSVKNNIIQVYEMPSFNNESQEINIFNKDSVLLDFGYYESSYHNELVKEEDNVSLERIWFNEPINSEGNWQSASLVSGRGTPGKENSTFENVESSPRFELDNEIIYCQNPQQNFATISFQNLNFDNFIDINVYNRHGKLIKELLPFSYSGTKGKIVWDGAASQGECQTGYFVILINYYREGKRKKKSFKIVVVK